MDELTEKTNYTDNIDDVISMNASTSKTKKTRDSKTVISNEMRKLVIRALETGMCSRKTAATTFNLSYTTVAAIYNRFLKTGEFEKKRTEKNKSVKIKKNPENNEMNLDPNIKKEYKIGRKSNSEKLKTDHVQFLVDSLAENCKYNLGELRLLLNDKFGLDVKIPTISSKLPPFHFNLLRAEDSALTTVTPEIINDHKEYCELFLQLTESGRPLIYFDETEFHITMKRFSVRIPPNKSRQNVPPPSLRIRKKTILASMSQDELLYYKALDGPNDRMRLLEYLNGLFDLLMNRNITGAVIIMGNAAFNYCNAITEAIQLAGHEVVFLPACSAFLNPVENLFSQWTFFIRAKNPTSEKELENLVCTFNGVVNSAQCQYYCTHVIENATSCVTGKLIYAK